MSAAVQTYTFDRAEVGPAEGVASRRHHATAVSLTVRPAPPGTPTVPGVRSPFLNGKLHAEGQFSEECPPGGSLVKRGHEAVLKLCALGKWTTVQILPLDLLGVQEHGPHRRLYRWSFLVVGQARDPLHLFPADKDDHLEIDDLLNLLGATRADLGGAVFNSEGGFRLPEN